MSGPDRFFCAGLGTVAPGATVELDADETRHAVRARRHRVGDRVELFDGLGWVSSAVVAAIPPRGPMRVEVVEVAEHVAPPRGLRIACAVPKGDRVETLLDMATQLGVTGFTLLEFERSVRTPGAGREARWRRIVVEASKQSRRVHLPRIEPLRDFREWLDGETGSARWLADPGAQSIQTHGLFDGVADRDPVVIVGPEGGLTPSERALALAAGCRPIGLGGNVLRIETAVVAAAALAAIRPAPDR